jgi:ribosome biogenesis GTPase A
MLDTPGVIPELEYSHTREEAIKKHAMIGARTSNTIRDPEMIVAELMKNYSKQIEKFYNIDAKGDPEVLIEKLGKKKSFLKKKGAVDEVRTSKLILQDWQEGKIRI